METTARGRLRLVLPRGGLQARALRAAAPLPMRSTSGSCQVDRAERRQGLAAALLSAGLKLRRDPVFSAAGSWIVLDPKTQQSVRTIASVAPCQVLGHADLAPDLWLDALAGTASCTRRFRSTPTCVV